VYTNFFIRKFHILYAHVYTLYKDEAINVMGVKVDGWRWNHFVSPLMSNHWNYITLKHRIQKQI